MKRQGRVNSTADHKWKNGCRLVECGGARQPQDLRAFDLVQSEARNPT